MRFSYLLFNNYSVNLKNGWILEFFVTGCIDAVGASMIGNGRKNIFNLSVRVTDPNQE